MSSAFDIDPKNYLSIEYTKYLNNLEEIAVSNPNQFFKMKANMVEEVKSATTLMIYNLIKGILSTGNCTGLNGGSHIYERVRPDLHPNYPKQLINDISLSLVETINNYLDQHVCDILMPRRLQSLVGQAHNINLPEGMTAAGNTNA